MDTESSIVILNKEKKPTEIQSGDQVIWNYREYSSFDIVRDGERLFFKHEDGSVFQYHEIPMDKDDFRRIMNLVAAVSGLKPRMEEGDGKISCTFLKA